MGYIYESSSWAYSWLGTDTDTDAGLHGVNRIESVQQLIEGSYKNEGIEWGITLLLSDAERFELLATALTKLESMGVDWTSVGAFLQNEYWSRGWICQEITVSPEVMFNTATAESDRIILGRAFKLLDMIRQTLRWDFEIQPEDGKLVPTSRKTDAPDLDNMVRWAQQLIWLRNMDMNFFNFVLRPSDDWLECRGFDLDQVMVATRSTNVALSLDRVYAFVGLMPQYAIVPNYGPENSLYRVP